MLKNDINKMAANEELIRSSITDDAVAEGLSLCRGVVQRYLAYLQGVEPTQLFADIQETNEVGFVDQNNREWCMKLDIVDDKFYKFPLEKCRGKAVRDMMEKIIRNLQLVCRLVMETELTPERVPRPELFMNSRLAITPLTSCFLYNEAHGRELHDAFPKRIAFVWTVEGRAREPNIARPCSHPDDFLGPVAKNMTDTEFISLVTEINRCHTCGALQCDC